MIMTMMMTMMITRRIPFFVFIWYCYYCLLLSIQDDTKKTTTATATTTLTLAFQTNKQQRQQQALFNWRRKIVHSFSIEQHTSNKNSLFFYFPSDDDADTTSSTSTTSFSSFRLHSSRKGNRGPSKQVSTNTQKRKQRSQINDVLNNINSPPTFPNSVDPNDVLSSGPIACDPLSPLIHTIVKAADMRKASNIVAMRISRISSTTSFLILVSGTSPPQNSAISNAIQKDVHEYHNGKRCIGNKGIPEGSPESGWIVLDYGDVMVHVMTPKSRLFYDLEGQWKSRGGEYMDLSNVLLMQDEEEDEEENMMRRMMVEEEEEEEEQEEDDDEFDDDDDRIQKNNNHHHVQTMKDKFDVEKEIDPFWS